MFDAPTSGEFTQGTVFTCAHGEHYERDVLGMIITARCDAAQDKVASFSYLPVVPLTSWILVDGASIVLDRAEADTLNTLRNLLKAAKLTESLLRTYSPQQIYEAHFQQREEERSHKSSCLKFREASATLDAIAQAKERQYETAELSSLLARHQAKVDTVLRELSGHRLSGYYLVRGLEDYTGRKADYVVLLREVHHISTPTARMIASGISQAELSLDHTEICPRFSDSEDFAMPLARLKSPWIEHLMQNFSLLFSRIGVADNDFEDVRKSLEAIGLAGK